MTTPTATASVRAANAALRAALPFDDTQDHEDAHRGFVGRLDPCIVRAADGRVVWDNESYRFLDGPCPDTVNPSLWRQSQLVAIDGLFEVVPGIYQVRGLDLSNITFVEGDTGVLVIDPLISTETAAAALALYRQHRGDRPVTGVIYTHSHIDHFGGVKGVTSQEDVDAGRCTIIAPEGFVEHAVAENVYAGTAMARRAGYMYGAVLARGPEGQVGAGLGQTTSSGTVTLIVPTDFITMTGEERVVDGIRMEFQVTPGTEAPAEMNLLFPDLHALCMAENTTHTLHNLLTLRGALVRDPRVWARYITESIDRFGDRTDVVFASHHWPTWGRERAMGYLSVQRDLYAYLHDQTLRMLNAGMTGAEIAEAIVLPPALECAWHARGYYGSVSHNVKAIYQRYMGLGFGAENGTWRCIYLAGATELRQGNFGTPTATAAADLMRALSPEQIFDAIAIRVDGPKAWHLSLSIGVDLADSGEQYRLDLRNGVLVHRLAPVGDAALIIRTSRAALPGLLAGQMGGINLEGDPSVLGQLLGVLQTPDPDFSIVTP